MCLFAIGIEHLLDVHICTSANKNPRRYLEQTAGACEQGMERGQPVTEADVARNGLTFLENLPDER
jgi:hypothetical protein